MRVQLKTKIIKYSSGKCFEIYINTNDRFKMPLLFSASNHISLASAYLTVFLMQFSLTRMLTLMYIYYTIRS